MIRRSRWLLVGAWAVPAALSTMQSYLLDSPQDCGGSLWRSAAREGLPWAVWVAATPLVLAAATRPGRRILRHVAAILAIGLAFGVANGVLGYLVRASEPVRSLAAQIEMGIADWLPIQPVIYAGVLAAGLAIDGARRRREIELAQARLETELAQAQLAALRAQLQPHFLFNTLNAAVTLARSGDSEGTARVLVLLGELLRQLLRDDAPQEVPLSEELELVELYLEIQRVRFGDRLRVVYRIDDGLRDALVPQLLLQPLVENAFRHGISQRTLAGRLDIAASRVGDHLELTVRDDGPGPDPDHALGVGLRNTRDRLRRLYGERGLVTLSGEGGGAVAAVTLPLREVPRCAS